MMKKTKRRRRRRGSILALFPGMLVVLCAIAAFMIDMGYVFVVENQLQMAAESSALAGALRLRDDAYETTIRANAITFAQLNEPDSGNVLVDADITLGVWDYDAKSFTPTIVEANAVRTIVRRDGANTSSTPTYFSKIFGMQNIAVSASAIVAFKVTVDENGDEEKELPYQVQ